MFCSHYVDMAKSFLITDKPFKKAHFSPHTQILSQIPSHLFLGFFVPNLIQEFTVSVVIYVLPNTSQYSPLSLLHNEHNSTGYFRFLFSTQNEANRQGVSSKIAEVAVPSVLDDVLSPSQHHVVVCEVGLYKYDNRLSGGPQNSKGGLVMLNSTPSFVWGRKQWKGVRGGKPQGGRPHPMLPAMGSAGAPFVVVQVILWIGGQLQV